jgi:DNA polymerase-3 subunit delta
MIVKPAEAERFISRPPPSLAAVLVFGPDQGLVRERAETLAKTVVPDLSDPFRVAEFDEDRLAGDPALLWDEAAAFSMLGGRRVVRVRGVGNAVAKHFQRFVEDPPGDALVVVEGGDLNKGSALRRVFEEADNAAAIICYVDSDRDLDEVVRSALKKEGLSIEREALADAVSRLGSDRGVTRRELEKLALYAMGEGTVTSADVQAVMGDESELRMDQAFDAAGEGDMAKLDQSLERLWLAGVSPVAVLRLALSHFQRLLQVKSESESGGDAAGAMARLRPPIHYMRKNSFAAQLQRLSSARLEEALNHLYEGEALVKTTGIPGEAVASRALLSVAALARGARE